MGNKQKILFSTKISQNVGSDMIGGSIAQILLADFYQSVFGYKVTLHDPFFNVEKILKHEFDEVLSTILYVNNFDRIANCQFYFGNYLYKNKVEIEIERHDLINKYLPFIEKNISIFRNNEMYSKQENIHFKFLDMPYIYQYDLMYKLRYRPSFRPAKKIIETNKDVYGVHIRQSHWKKIKTRKDIEIIEFYVNIFEKIKSNNGLIIYYGSFDDEFESRIRKYNVINGNTFSEYPLERALLLSRVNHSITSINGFSLFSNYLALANNNLRNISIVNDLEKISELAHLRRIYSEGLLESKIGKTGIHSKFRIYPANTAVESNLEFQKNDFLDFQQGVEIKPRLIFFKSEYLGKYFLSEKLDNILIANLYLYMVSKGFDARYFDKNDILDSDVYLLTHYNLDIKGNKILGKRSLDFNKPKILNDMANIGPDQLFYEDMLDFLYRAKLDQPQPNIRVGKVAFISGYKMNYSPNKTWIKIINLALRFILIDEKISKSLKYIKRRFYNYVIPKDLNPLNNSTDIFSKFSFYSAAEIESNDLDYINSIVNMIISKYDRIVCEPSRMSLILSALDNQSKLILFTENFENFVLNSPTFSDAPEYKISDFFPIHFQGISELKVHLKSLNFDF